MTEPFTLFNGQLKPALYATFSYFRRMEVVVSGTRPTGILHLGNYYGAVRNYVRLADDPAVQGYFFIADYHSLTTHHQPEELKTLVYQTAATYLACGLDPEKVVLYVQSEIPQIPELYLLLNMLAYKGELEKVATFKEKIKIHKENINAGLLTYPVLMAADIIIHRAHKVPVGKDQEQHLEMTRNFAKRFNSRYGVDLFPEPVAYNFGEALAKVPGLDGSLKMSKTGGETNAIFLNEAPDVLRKKIMRAKTDSGPTKPNSEKPQEIKNLFALLEIVSRPDTISQFDEAWNNCTIRYGDLKKQLAEDMIQFLTPIREKINGLMEDTAQLAGILRRGSEAARENAQKTISEVRKIVGINYF